MRVYSFLRLSMLFFTLSKIFTFTASTDIDFTVTFSGQISSCVASQLYMLSIPGSIPTAHTIVGTGGSVL